MACPLMCVHRGVSADVCPLTCVCSLQIVSVKIPDPEFEGQTKTRLGNPEVRQITSKLVSDCMEDYLRTDAPTLKVIVAKAVTAQRAADAAKRARDMVRRKSVLTRSTLPGKLADCTSTDKSTTEIFIVEGESAGGSAKQVRIPHSLSPSAPLHVLLERYCRAGKRQNLWD